MAEDRLRILLIEHDTGFTRAVGDMLQQVPELDVELHPADDLPAGLDVLNALPVDLVLLDAYLPDGAGLGNVALLRAEAPHVPIIVAGDSDDEVVALEAVHAGAQDYLVKSQITPGWLDRSIRYAIERHHMDMALLAAEEKYHSVFDHLVEGIFQTTWPWREFTVTPHPRTSSPASRTSATAFMWTRAGAMSSCGSCRSTTPSPVSSRRCTAPTAR
jgi:DNA-binding NarL/FixJ family response regulator